MDSKRRKSTITEYLSEQNRSCLTDGEIEQIIISLKKHLEAAQAIVRSLNLLNGDPILATHASQLEADFTEEEIKHAVFYLGTNKSPGPNGFTAELFF